MTNLGRDIVITAAPGGFKVAGEVDANSTGAITSHIDEFLQSSDSLSLDLAGVSFMDSSGLNVLLSATETARGQGGDLTIVSPSPIVMRLFELTSLLDHFTVIDPT